MSDYVILKESMITFNSRKNHDQFIKQLNDIKYFLDFFDCLQIGNKIKKGDNYELTYHADHSCELGASQLYKLITRIIHLCKKYNNSLSITMISFNDTEMELYLVVKNNKIYDIGNKINKSIKKIVDNIDCPEKITDVDD